MKASRVFRVVDSHTAGEPTRVLSEGLPQLKGKDMEQRRQYFQKHYDSIRTTLLQEPRKNLGVAAIIVPPANPSADFGLIFCDFKGYIRMCIHGTIGVVTTLVELGHLERRVVMKGLVFDTPSGLVHARAKISSGRMSVLVRNVPSYYMGQVSVDIGGRKEVAASIAYGGNVFAYINAKDIDLTIVPKNLRTLLSLGRQVLPQFEKVVGVSFYEDLPEFSRNIMISENDLFDRSPCGTGTCGRMAILHHEGKLSPGRTFVNKSILGTSFSGNIVRVGKRDGVDAVISEIECTAYLTGTAEIIVSEKDKLASGFMLEP
jgi:proline racemase